MGSILGIARPVQGGCFIQKPSPSVHKHLVPFFSPEASLCTPQSRAADPHVQTAMLRLDPTPFPALCFLPALRGWGHQCPIWGRSNSWPWTVWLVQEAVRKPTRGLILQGGPSLHPLYTALAPIQGFLYPLFEIGLCTMTPLLNIYLIC